MFRWPRGHIPQTVTEVQESPALRAHRNTVAKTPVSQVNYGSLTLACRSVSESLLYCLLTVTVEIGVYMLLTLGITCKISDLFLAFMVQILYTNHWVWSFMILWLRARAIGPRRKQKRSAVVLKSSLAKKRSSDTIWERQCWCDAAVINSVTSVREAAYLEMVFHSCHSARLTE